MREPRYPNVEIKATRIELDYPLHVICRAKRALRRAGVSEKRITRMRNGALAAYAKSDERYFPSYDASRKRLLCYLRRWVVVRYVKTVVRVAKIQEVESGWHRWVSQWTHPISGEVQGSTFKEQTENLERSFGKGFKVVFVDPTTIGKGESPKQREKVPCTT